MYVDASDIGQTLNAAFRIWLHFVCPQDCVCVCVCINHVCFFVRYYIGRRPIVVLADPDIIRLVTVKGFSTFPNRLVRGHTHTHMHMEGNKGHTYASL